MTTTESPDALHTLTVSLSVSGQEDLHISIQTSKEDWLSNCWKVMSTLLTPSPPSGLSQSTREQLSQRIKALSMPDIEAAALNGSYDTPPIPTALAILRDYVVKLVEEA